MSVKKQERGIEMSSEKELKKFAAEIRLETVKCIKRRGFGHVGGCMSIADVLAVLYKDIMKVDPKNPVWEDRDYLVLSKGHAGPALFATLALKGYFPLEWLNTMSDPGTKLPSHADRMRTPGVDVTTGSLGQGLSIGAGLAKGFKIRQKENRAFVILGDGECAEGQNWEAAMAASHYKLGNLIAFVDWNKRQVDGYVENIMDLGDIEEKFKAFGWYAVTVDGKNPAAIEDAIVKAMERQNDRPAAIVLDGVKGAGVPEFEGMFDNHFFNLDEKLADQVIEELKAEIEERR